MGGFGGGVFNGSKLILSTCTISGNTCGNGGDGGNGTDSFLGSGGGVRVLPEAPAVGSTMQEQNDSSSLPSDFVQLH